VDIITTLVIAAFGGLVFNLMNLWEDTKKPTPERVAKDGFYWFFFAIWPGIAAALAYILILDGSVLRPLLAFTTGLGAPTIIKSLMSAAAPGAAPPAIAEKG
jgi:hypothetical protein